MSLWNLILSVTEAVVVPGPGLDPVALSIAGPCEMLSMALDGAEAVLQAQHAAGYEAAAAVLGPMIVEERRVGCLREKKALVDGYRIGYAKGRKA